MSETPTHVEGLAHLGVEQRSAFLTRYGQLGEFTSRDMGIPLENGVITLPSRVITTFEDTLSRQQSPFVRRDMESPLMAIFNSPRGVEAHPVFEARTEVRGSEFADVLIAENRALLEASFVVDGFGDIGGTARLLFAYEVVQSAIKPEMYEFLPDQAGQDALVAARLEKMKSIIRKHDLMYLFPTQAILPGGRTEQWTEDSLAESIDTLALMVASLARGTSIDIKFFQAMFKTEVGSIPPLGAYLYALVKSGEAKHIFIDRNGDFDPALLIQAVVTYAKAETAAELEDNLVLSVLQSRYSTYLNLLFDATIQCVSQDAFALGNAAILQQLGMDDLSYLHRAKITRTNPHLEEVGDLTSLKRAFAEDEPLITTTHKSVYTALSEALSLTKNKEVFLHLLSKYNIALPKSLQSQMLLKQDFYEIHALNKLMQIWKIGNDPEINSFMEAIFTSVQDRKDLVRGSIYPPEDSITAIVNEAIAKGVKLEIILNSNRHETPPFYTISSHEDLFRVAEALGVEVNDENRDDLPVIILRKFYSSRQGQYPYGAFHIVGKARCDLSLYQLGDDTREALGIPTMQYETEVRIVPREAAALALEAREAYKGYGGQHVISDMDLE